MSVINTNVKAIVAQNALTANNRVLSKSMEQLSTGRRINSAADDAAGLAISQKMTSQIRGLNQAVRNANDGISMLQTAEGAMVEVTNMMQRMRELAVQSASDTNTADDRNYLDLEFKQLRGEIDRIVNNTQWNGVNVLDSSFSNNGSSAATVGKFIFQVGANADQTISHQLKVFSLGAEDGNSASVAIAATAVVATPTTEQVATLTVSGTYAAGDVISVNLNQSMFRYTVTESEGTTSASVAAGLATALSTRFDDGYAIATSGTGVVKVTLDETDTYGSHGLTATNQFSISVADSDGEWDPLESLSISTQAGSDTAITTLDVQIASVNKARAEIGAVVNRLTYAIDNLSNISTNATDSRSRIMDTEYAKATTELARSQIVQQAATAMLAQANQQPQAVLSLLQ